MSTKIEHDKKYQQFSITIGDDEAELAYATPSEKVLDFTHTYVPEEARGKGVADELISAGLKYADENGFQVIATCTAVQTFLERHSEFKRLLQQ